MSRYEFKLPDIGEGVAEGEIVGWLVKPGEMVAEDQDMVEVMTDKATVTIGAPRAGRVAEVRGAPGDVVPVGQVLVVLELDAASGVEAQAPRSPVASAVGDLKDVLPGMPSSPRIVSADYLNEKPLASPATRKHAREVGVDIHRIRPTGEGGRVTREDVDLAASARGAATAAPAAGITLAPGTAPGMHAAVTVRPASEPSAHETAAAPAAAGRDVVVSRGVARPSPGVEAPAEQRVPIRGIRKRIYENMARSKRTAAHFTFVDECDVTALKALRQGAAAQATTLGVSISYLPFIVKAVVAALRKHPALNCLVDDVTQEMVLRGTYDVGIAVATEGGLTVPVLRGADRRSVIEIAVELERLATDARSGKTRREDLGGSSFTITSLGKQGGLFATPIVNYPEVAILGVHQIKKRPVVRNDAIVVGEVMLLSLSFDHRIIDGHVGAAFAAEVIQYLEAPERLMLEMR